MTKLSIWHLPAQLAIRRRVLSDRWNIFSLIQLNSAACWGFHGLKVPSTDQERFVTTGKCQTEWLPPQSSLTTVYHMFMYQFSSLTTKKFQCKDSNKFIRESQRNKTAKSTSCLDTLTRFKSWLYHLLAVILFKLCNISVYSLSSIMEMIMLWSHGVVIKWENTLKEYKWILS